MTRKGQEHEEEASYNRCGDAVLREERYLAADEETNQQKYGSHGSGHYHIALDVQNTVNCFQRHNTILLSIKSFFSNTNVLYH